MKLDQSQSRISELMSIFVTQIRSNTAMGRMDINRVSETVLIPLFAEIYGYKDLKNLNDVEKENFPGIDLGDETVRVAFQITATADSNKVKETLRKFVEYRLYERYDRLIIYILTEKRKSYSGSGYDEIIQSKFDFDKDRDIWDYRNLLKEISTFQIDRARRVEEILEANFGQKTAWKFGEVYEPQTETVYLNLLELFFPDTLYMSDLAIDRAEVIKNSKDCEFKLKKSSTWRDVVRAALEQLGLKFGVDWATHERKLITFHDLNDEDLPLSQVVDPNATQSLSPGEFYEISDDYERIFKSLLRRCMQQKLYHLQIKWQHQEKLFIFDEETEGMKKRREQWYGQRQNTRTVYEKVMKKDKSDEILHYKHLAFMTQYKRFGNQWYLLIKPDWFFSFDGYRRSFYSSGNVDWLKKEEKNSQVFNHLKFICHILTYDKPPELFHQRHGYPFLRFGRFLSFDSAPALDDEKWLEKETDESKGKLLDSQQIPLPFDA